MNVSKITFAILRQILIFLKLSYVKIVVNMTSLNLKLASTDEAVIFNRAWATKPIKLTYPLPQLDYLLSLRQIHYSFHSILKLRLPAISPQKCANDSCLLNSFTHGIEQVASTHNNRPSTLNVTHMILLSHFSVSNTNVHALCMQFVLHVHLILLHLPPLPHIEFGSYVIANNFVSDYTWWPIIDDLF